MEPDPDDEARVDLEENRDVERGQLTRLPTGVVPARMWQQRSSVEPTFQHEGDDGDEKP